MLCNKDGNLRDAEINHGVVWIRQHEAACMWNLSSHETDCKC